MSTETIHTGCITLRYFRFGAENGQPFVIIPGVSLKSVMESDELIKAQYKCLAERFCIYVIDRRENIPDTYSIYDMADDTAAALKALGVKDAVLYGVSQGGMIAQAIAIKHPGLVSRLTVCSTAPYIPERAGKVFDSWAALAQGRQRRELIESFAVNVYTQEYREKYHNAFISFADSVTDDELARFVTMCGGFKGFDVRRELGSITAPVLAIGSENDKLFSSEGAELIAAQTNGKKLIYQNEAHSVYDENADVLAQITAFLKDCE